MKKFLQKFSYLRINCCLPFSSRRNSSSSLTISIVNKYQDRHGAPISISTRVFPDGPDDPISVLPDVDTTATDTSHAVVDVDAHISIHPVSGTAISSCESHGDDFPGLPDDDADTSTTHTPSYGEEDLPDDDAATSTTRTSSYDEDGADAPINKYKSHDDDDDDDDDDDVDDAPISISPVDDPTPISTSHDDDDDGSLSIWTMLPDDILCEIFHRLPLESLHRSKWVSRSWHSLITRQTLPKVLQTRFIGFYHCAVALPRLEKTSRNAAEHFNCALTGAVCDGSSIDLTLSFLPSFYQPWVLDSRNGLLLCFFLGGRPARPEPSICVCNPCTKSWTKIPFDDPDLIPFHTFRLVNHMFLDFDPSIAPHYKVIALFAGDRPGALEFTIPRREGWRRNS